MWEFRLAKRNRNSFSSSLLFFLCIWCPFLVPVYRDKRGRQNESWRLIKNGWWRFRKCVYVHREWGGMIPFGVAWQKANDKFFKMVLLIVKAQQKQIFSFFEWLIKNLKWLSHLCVLCVQWCYLKSHQTLPVFANLHSVTRISLFTFSS